MLRGLWRWFWSGGASPPSSPGGTFRRLDVSRAWFSPDPTRLIRRLDVSRTFWRATMSAPPRRLPKKPTERREFCFGFQTFPEVRAGDNLASAVVTQPGGAALTGLTAGSPSVTAADFADPELPNAVPAGMGVLVELSAGTHGTDYPIECLATLASGRKVAVQGVVEVRNVTA